MKQEPSRADSSDSMDIIIKIYIIKIQIHSSCEIEDFVDIYNIYNV